MYNTTPQVQTWYIGPKFLVLHTKFYGICCARCCSPALCAQNVLMNPKEAKMCAPSWEPSGLLVSVRAARHHAQSLLLLPGGASRGLGPQVSTALPTRNHAACGGPQLPFLQSPVSAAGMVAEPEIPPPIRCTLRNHSRVYGPNVTPGTECNPERKKNSQSNLPYPPPRKNCPQSLAVLSGLHCTFSHWLFFLGYVLSHWLFFCYVPTLSLALLSGLRFVPGICFGA